MKNMEIVKKDNVPSKGSATRDLLNQMIGENEIIKQVTVKTTVKTDVAEHTVWEVGKKNGDKAIFSNTKNKK